MGNYEEYDLIAMWIIILYFLAYIQQIMTKENGYNTKEWSKASIWDNKVRTYYICPKAHTQKTFLWEESWSIEVTMVWGSSSTQHRTMGRHE